MYLTVHEHIPNRGVKIFTVSPGRTQHVGISCMRVWCAATKTSTPLTCVLHPPGTETLVATPPEQVSTVWSYQHHRVECGRRSRTKDHPPFMLDRAWACRAPCFASRSTTPPSPSVTLMFRAAAGENTNRDGRWASAGPSRHVIRRKWTGFVCEVNSLQWQCLISNQDATPLWPHHHRSTAAAVAAGRCWRCFSARADSLHGHV